MNTLTLSQSNFANLILNYIDLLLQSEKMHEKLERLYSKLTIKTSKYLRNQILTLNNLLNNICLKIMNLQLALNALWMPAKV